MSLNAIDGLDRSVQPMGHINPDVPPLTEKENVFNTVDRDRKSNGSETFFEDEKAGTTVQVEENVADNFIHDPFHPFDGLPEERHRVITVRAMVIGCICGAVVNASNIYLGLKTGWTFSANLFGAIAGFTVIKFFSSAFPENFPILGGSFGPRENNIIQTAATAAGGISSVFISGIPALYTLGLLETPKKDFARIITLTIVGGYFGFFFATPLRKFFIIYVARELRLVFPTPSATSMTIRAMHEAIGGAESAKKKMKALGIAFIFATVLRVVSVYAVGILWDWHIFTWFFIWGHYKNAALAAENWGWLIEWTPAFIGAGMLVGLNVGISFFMGSVIAWGIIGPALVHNGAAFGLPLGAAITDDPHWEGYINMFSLGAKASNKDTPSPRFWLLWPGVLGMIAISFTELALQWRVILFAFRAVARGLASGLYAAGKAAGKEVPWLHEKSQQEETDMVEDPAPPEQLVKVWMWAPGLIIVIICTCVVMGVQFDMPVGMTLLSIFLAFFFSFLAVQCSGVTDITPLTAASKASQIVLGGATKGEHWNVDHARRLNLLGGSLASVGANQASDLVGDFRVGFLLRTPPNQQWIAQGLGTIVAVFLAPAMFVLFTSAYPCIIDPEAETCPFGAPSVSAWRAVAVAVTDPVFPVPTSSGIFSVVFAAFGAFMVLLRHFVWVGRLEWVRKWHPNMMCISLAFTLPYTVYGTAMLMGSILAWAWAKKNPSQFDVYGYAVAAGLIAGEGIGGVINAIFQVAGIGGDKYGVGIGCPAGSC